MPGTWYAALIADGRIADADLSVAQDGPQSMTALEAATHESEPEITALPSVADLAAKASDTD